MFVKLLKRTPEIPVAEKLYGAIVAQARTPAFYAALGVPDTPLGRFEMIALHAYLLFRRLKTGGPEDRALAQGVHDVMFADMDRSLREMGVGDLGVGKRVKKLATNLYGRIAAYDEGMDNGEPDRGEIDEGALVAALTRNVFAEAAEGAARPVALAAYVQAQEAVLSDQSRAAIHGGEVHFGPVTAAP